MRRGWTKRLPNIINTKQRKEKTKMLALNAVRCKVLSRVFAVINRETPFVNTQKFAA